MGMKWRFKENVNRVYPLTLLVVPLNSVVSQRDLQYSVMLLGII